MEELVFHFGGPKTGSSALQVFLAQNIAGLADQSIDYLRIGDAELGRIGKISSGNGGHLARALFPKNHPFRVAKADHYLGEFLHALASSSLQRGIVSSEIFVDSDHQMLGDLIKKIDKTGARSSLIYYIRSPVQTLCSGYMQQVKRHGYTASASDYVVGAYKHMPFLRVHSFYHKMRDLFGDNSIKVLVFDEIMQKPGSLVTSFLDALSIDRSGFNTDVSDINTSLSHSDVALMVALNRFRPRMNFSDMVVENAVTAGTAASGQIHRLLPPALEAEIEGYFEEENRRFAQEYFGRDDLYARSPVEQTGTTPTGAGLTVDDVVNFFGGLIVRYDERLVRLEATVTALTKR